MNQAQKLVQQEFLYNEEKIISRLHATYSRSLVEIDRKIQKLMERFDPETGDLPQSAVYQLKYQKMLKAQVEGILDEMNQKNFQDVADYLDTCYTDGFVGAVFDQHSQGIPLMMPIDQMAVIRAVQLDSKISEGLYTKLGEDTHLLKRKIYSAVSRSIATGATYAQTAKNLADHSRIGYNNAIRIARTEGHRIQTTAAMDAMQQAKSIGADVLKQWDSTLDGATRPSHQMVDGEIRELDKDFSNGLSYPGDPDGGAAEVINCRCALLQRARWALDDDELEHLKERAAYFGLDKTATFEEFKKAYLEATQQPKVTPKKEYLTKKKLEQKIADGKVQLTDLDDQFKTATYGLSYDEVIKNYGSLDGFASGSHLKQLKALHKQADDLQKQLDDWDDMLQKKIVASESKKLKKDMILLQDQLDNYQIDTYSGIWKDDVTTKDWFAKQSSIPKKKIYFEDKLKYATDQAEIDKWQELLDSLDDFDKKGAAYYAIQKQYDDADAKLKKLLTGNKPKSSSADLDAFTQARKDAALWAKTTKTADDALRDVSGKAWQSSTSSERYAIYDYTCGSGKFNRPLSGFEKPYYEYGSGWEPKYNKGVGKVWIDYEGAGDEIRDMTNIISKSSYDFDVWLQRGCQGNAMESFLGLSPNTFEYMSHDDLQQFVGRSNRIWSFTSCGVSKGTGFDHQPVIMNIYAPKGTNMMYAEPFSHFGMGGKLNWDGVSKQSYFGSEAEMIIQRGASYTITKIEKSGYKIYIDVEVHPEDGYDLMQQDPNEWKGSKQKGR